jgi:hypothetical protein
MSVTKRQIFTNKVLAPYSLETHVRNARPTGQRTVQTLYLKENVRRHLIYVTSVMPKRGETMASFGGSELGPWMDPLPQDGMMGLKAELAPDAFLQDCDEEASQEDEWVNP